MYDFNDLLIEIIMMAESNEELNALLKEILTEE